jgi:hypothetical protein
MARSVLLLFSRRTEVITRTAIVKVQGIDFIDNRFGGFTTAFPAFKVSAKNGLFLGQRTCGQVR